MITVTLIYHHAERDLTTSLRKALEQHNYTVQMAPIGFQVGSAEWQAAVKQDFARTDVFVPLVTGQALNDEWFNWRIAEATSQLKERRRPLVLPLLMDITRQEALASPGGMNVLLSASQSITFPSFIHLQAGSESPYEDILASIARFKPNRLAFISYSREDGPFAARLAQDLRNKGLDTWRDEENIPPGVAWDNEIQRGLKQATHILLVATLHSVESANVADEISYALKLGKVIIPLMVEDCELPMRVHRAQWVDFRLGYEAGLEKLLAQMGAP